MSGETDLTRMLATLTVARRDGCYSYVHLDRLPADISDAAAIIHEDEGVTVVVPAAAAARHGWESRFDAVWLTLEVHSSLEAVGLTAAVADAFAAAGIPCNVIAGTFHDHLLVPVAKADRALAVLSDLAG